MASPDDSPGGSKYQAVVAAMHQWSACNNVAEEDIFLCFDWVSVEQDDLSELTRGVNFLGMYIAVCDALITIEHVEYWNRTWCLVVVAFANAANVARYTFSADRTLSNATIIEKLSLKKPSEADLTVEEDRFFIGSFEQLIQRV